MFGPINKSASDCLAVLAQKISQRSGDERETVFLFQRISVVLQRFNSILLHDSFVRGDCPVTPTICYVNFFFPKPSGSLILRVKIILIIIII